jgi:hypothetical protein
LKISPECYLLLVSVELKTVLSAPCVSDTARVKGENIGGNQTNLFNIQIIAET